MSTLQDLLEQQAALERHIAEARSLARAEAIAQIREVMTRNSLTAADLVAPAKQGSSTVKGSKVAAKYRDPESGATWTGRGLKPKWLERQLANGKQVSDFAI
jgi:DNA-binding protein H-NS